MTFDDYCNKTGHYAENGDRAMWDAAQQAERERWAHVFDGWRVLQALTPEQRKRIGYADVSDVLDAVARLSRA